MKKIKLTKNWKGHKAGTILEVDEDTYAEIVAAEAGSEYDAEAEGRAQKDREAVINAAAEAAVEAVEEKFRTLDLGKKMVHIEVKDRDLGDAGPFRNIGEQMKTIVAAERGDVKSREQLSQIKAPSGLGEIVDADGGYLVQTDLQSGIWQRVIETGILARRCERVPISGNANGLRWNAIVETSRADGSRHGGIQVYRTAEAASKTASAPTFEERKMDLEKLTGLYYSTDELLADTTALTSIIGTWFGEEFGFKIDDEIIRGTGAGQMLGILNAGCTVSVAKETGQSATTIVADNIEKMWERMWAPSLKRAEWFINQDCWSQLFKLQHTVGTGGMPVFMRPTGLAEAPYGTLLGRPIVPIEQAATLGTVGDIIFADLSQYRIIEKGGIETATSIHVKFLTDQTAFRFVVRNNGQPTWKSALTPTQGSNTLSPFVTLATRS